MRVLDKTGRRPEAKVAIANVCAWPNLTRLPDGDIVALIHNQPSHGQMPGDIECWGSKDEGDTWERRAVAAPRASAEQNRMNHAAGLTTEGHLILVTSGWSKPGDPDAQGRAFYGEILPTWVCISKDGGRTWSIDKESFPHDPRGLALVPFGDIMSGKDGKLRVAAYGGRQNYVIRGDGESWGTPVSLSDTLGFNETALLHQGDGQWLAAARYQSEGLVVYHSEDDAKTWECRSKPTGKLMHPAHLLRLADGGLVLSYGNRNALKGVEVLFSDDEGHTWGKPYRVLDAGRGDIGYPSSVQRKDGCILTAYYANSVPGIGGYHMGVVVWDPARTRKDEKD